MTIKEVFQNERIKLTKQRKQVVSILSESAQPLSLDEIEKNCDGVDFSSIYRTIKLLIEKGIVKEHYFGGRKAKYYLNDGSRHFHFIKCVKCGKIEELKNICVLNEVKKRTTYKIVDHYMEFTGLCPRCSKN